MQYPSRLVLFTILGILLIGLVSTPVAAHHKHNYDDDDSEEGIFEYVEQKANENGEAFGIPDPYSLFTSDKGDEEKVNDQDDLNSHFSNESDSRSFHEIGDYTFDTYPSEVTKWNRNVVNQFTGINWDRNRPQETRYPAIVEGEFGNSGYIKDAYVTFFSFDPSVVIHERPEAGSDTKDETSYRVGEDITINAVTAARLEPPTSDVKNVPDVMKEIRLENRELEYVRIHRYKCDNSEWCLLGNDSTGSHNPTFTDVTLPEGETHRLRVQAKYSVKYRIETHTRDWECEKAGEYGEGETRPPRPSQGNDGPGWDCEWTEWELVKKTFTSSELQVDNSTKVAVPKPDVRVHKAYLPQNRVEYEFTGLDRGEYSRVTYTVNNEEYLAFEAPWRYLSARDVRWDLYCERNGKSKEVVADDCSKNADDQNADNPKDARHYEFSAARPLVTRAIPEPDGFSVGQGRGIIRRTEGTRSTSLPNLEEAPRCDGNCHWTIDSYLRQEQENEEFYNEPQSVIYRPSTRPDSVHMYGIVSSSKTELKPYTEREVHTAVPNVTVIKKYQPSAPNSVLRLPGVDDSKKIELRIGAIDKQEDTGIDFTDREGRIIIETAEERRVINPDENGEKYTLDVGEDAEYHVSIETENWWDLPLYKQAYISEAELDDTAKESWVQPYGLIRLVITMGALLLLLFLPAKKIASMAGVDLELNDMWTVFGGGKFSPWSLIQLITAITILLLMAQLLLTKLIGIIS